MIRASIVTPITERSLFIRMNPGPLLIGTHSTSGIKSSVYFNQKGNSDWVALNRIYDQNPSQIYGSLKADGKIYLINQNGILFGRGSKVNVNTLVASALNIKDEDFLIDIWKENGNDLSKVLNFKQEEYEGMGFDRLAIVSNEGEISTTGGGSVFLMAPRVENSGVINSPLGQVGLVAGTEVTLAQPTQSETRSAYYVIVNAEEPRSDDATFGKAVNREGGKLNADGGMAGMYGDTVDQWGIIRSVTAFQNKKGNVELRAANKITTYENSRIELPVDASLDPETGKIRTVSDTFDIQSAVDIEGLHSWRRYEMWNPLIP